MGRTKPLESKPADLQAIEAREAAIRLAAHARSQAEGEIAIAHARTAAKWIASNRPDISFGAEPGLMLIAEDDHYSLVDLETSTGFAGNAVKLSDGVFGELWWCDPQGRETDIHECLVFAAKGTSGASARTVLMRFLRARNSRKEA